jgi:hydroxymethylglutaryl-CoA reductase (NADPH)
MVGRATFAACSWILDVYAGVQRFYLESNFATDKKASQINIMRTRGKRVTAEALIRREVLVQQMRVDTESLAYHYNVANIGSILSGSTTTACTANAITATTPRGRRRHTNRPPDFVRRATTRTSFSTPFRR